MRAGESRRLMDPPRETGNFFEVVYTEMLLQIALYYPGLPDARTLSISEIRFFYEGIRGELMRATKPK